jgi:hypothetical protein
VAEDDTVSVEQVVADGEREEVEEPVDVTQLLGVAD